MPEILNDAGLYFDPLIPESIADCIENTIKNNTNHMDLKTKAYKRAKITHGRNAQTRHLIL